MWADLNGDCTFEASSSLTQPSSEEIRMFGDQNADGVIDTEFPYIWEVDQTITLCPAGAYANDRELLTTFDITQVPQLHGPFEYKFQVPDLPNNKAKITTTFRVILRYAVWPEDDPNIDFIDDGQSGACEPDWGNVEDYTVTINAE